MSIELYEDLLRDIVKEINVIALDDNIWGSSDFDRGYQAGMMVVMKAIQDKLQAFGASGSVRLVDVDEWFRLGRDYAPTDI